MFGAGALWAGSPVRLSLAPGMLLLRRKRQLLVMAASS